MRKRMTRMTLMMLVGGGLAGVVGLALARQRGWALARVGGTADARADSPVPARVRVVILPFARRWFNPLMLRIAGRRHSPFALLRHTGRRSGREYATPVMATLAGDDVIIPMTYGEATDWVRNVLAAGNCVVELDGQRIAATAPVVLTAAEALPRLSRWVRLGARVVGIRRYLRVSRVSDA